ncbi:unnamed protein product [Effrenium voratum]|nr:unnamed protein product [Effrenium voratum]
MDTGDRARVLSIPRRLWKDLPFVSKVIFIHGVLDILVPNPMTAAPLFRIFDLQHRSKKKRGWAWLFFMFGCMKIRGSLSDELTAAHVAGWAYFWQALSISVEGFWHRSIPRATKVLSSHIGFCVAVFAYLQVQKWRHASEAVADGQPDGEPVLAPSALAALALLGDAHQSPVRRHGRPRTEGDSSSLQTSSRLFTSLTQLYPFYHSSEELQAEARRVTAGCEASLRSVAQGNVSIDVARVKACTPELPSKITRAMFRSLQYFT